MNMQRPIHGGNLFWAAYQIGCPASSILDFSASINPLGPPQSVLNAIQDALQDINHYPDPNYTQLRKILAQYHHLPPEWILIGNGVAELLTWAGRELAQEERTYVFKPFFNDYLRALKTFQANIEPVDFLWQQDNPIATLTSFKRKKSGVIVNNPHNPTGKLLKKEFFIPLLEESSLVVVDEAFMDFVDPLQEQSLISWISKYSNLIILRSLTKFYSIPGLRLGYVISHPDRIKKWQTWRDPWCVNYLAMVAGIAAINDKEFTYNTKRWLSFTSEKLFKGLSKIKGLKPISSSVNFFLVETSMKSSTLQQKLLQKYHILIRDCLSFPELGDKYFRVAVRKHQDNKKLLDALLEILSI